MAAKPAEATPDDVKFFEVMDRHMPRGFVWVMRHLPAEPRCRLVLLGPVQQAPDQRDQLLAIGGFHVLAGRDVGFGEPLLGNVAASGGVIFRHVARNVDQLEGEPERQAEVAERIDLVG